MLSSEAFADFSKDVLLFLHVTTRIEGAEHDDLLVEVGGDGFPFLVCLDGDGHPIARVKGRDVGAFKTAIDDANRFLKLRSRAASGDPDAVAPYYIAQLELGILDYDEAKRQRNGLEGLTKAHAEHIDDMLVALEYRANTEDDDDPVAVGERLFGMARAGRIPKDLADRNMFLIYLARFAEKKRVLPAMEIVVKEFERLAETNPRYERSLARYQRKLEALRDK